MPCKRCTCRICQEYRKRQKLKRSKRARERREERYIETLMIARRDSPYNFSGQVHCGLCDWVIATSMANASQVLDAHGRDKHPELYTVPQS